MSGRIPGGIECRRWGWLLAIVTTIAVATPTAAVSVSVSRFDLSGTAGSRLDTSFVVLNDETEPLDVRLTLVDWEVDEQGVTRMAVSGTLERSCAGWTDVAPAALALDPGAEADIGIGVTIPEEVNGSHWAGVLLRVAPVDEEDGRGTVRLVRQFLVRVVVTVPPTRPAGRVSSVTTAGLDPLRVRVRFDNVGDTYLTDVNGLVTIQDDASRSLAELPIGPFHVLPGYDIERVVRWSWGIDRPGLYLIRAVIDFGGDHLVAGQMALRVEALELTPIGDAAAPPADLDGDGRYEDIDGDGVLRPADPELLARHLASRPVTENARAFDFDNDGQLTASDIVWLERRVSRTTD